MAGLEVLDASQRASQCAVEHKGKQFEIRLGLRPEERPFGPEEVRRVEDQWLTAKEAAQYLKVKPRTLLLWTRQKKVPAHRLSGVQRCVYRFLKRELDSMLELSSAEPADGGQQ